ncbi:DUF7224 domain-containing protein [Streptomyces sp. NPDC001212]
MVRIYLIELRRSPLLIALPLMIVIDLLVLFGRSRYWIGVWSEASAASQVTTLFLGPVLAAVSAWQAGRSSRSEMPAFLLASARQAWYAEAARLAATLTLGLGAYGVGCVIAAIASLPEAGGGFLWPSYLLVGVATLTMYAAVGHLIGRIWPSPAFTPVVCALGGFILFLVVGQAYGLFVLSGAPDTIVRHDAVAARLFLASVLLVIAVVAPVGRRFRNSGETSFYPIPLGVRCVFAFSLPLCFIAFAGLLFAGPLREARSATANNMLCDRVSVDTPRVCVWRDHGKYLPSLTRMAERLDQIPQEWIKVPPIFYESGLRPTPLGDRGFEIAEGHVRAAAIAMASQVSMESLGMGQCLPPETASRAWRAVDRIDLWLEYRAMGESPTKADAGLHMEGMSDAKQAAARIVAASESDQQQWVKEERTYVREAGCAPR